MARNPTLQHLAQTLLLAPDFLEARARFAGQAAVGVLAKVQHEQLAALAFLALVQWGASRILNKLLDGDWHWDHPFEVINDNRRYRMRSVPEDLFMLFKDRRAFVRGRLSPIVGRGLIEWISGVNWRGEPVSGADTLGNIVAGMIPLTLQPLTRRFSQEGRYETVTPFEQLFSSLGLAISRYSPASKIYHLANEWIAEHGDEYGIEKEKASYPISKYQQLRYALEDDNQEKARSEITRLTKELTITRSELIKRMKLSLGKPFTGSVKADKAFRKSLSGGNAALYDAAIERRKQLIDRLRSIKLAPAPAP